MAPRAWAQRGARGLDPDDLSHVQTTLEGGGGMTELWIALYFGAGALTVFWDCRHEPVHLRGRGEAALFAALSLMLSVLWPIYVLGAVMGRLLAQIAAQDRADMEDDNAR